VPTSGRSCQKWGLSHAHPGPSNESVILKSAFGDEGSLSSQRDLSRRREFSRHISPSVSTLSDREQSWISSERAQPRSGEKCSPRRKAWVTQHHVKKPRRGESKTLRHASSPGLELFPQPRESTQLIPNSQIPTHTAISTLNPITAHAEIPDPHPLRSTPLLF
jgi:hypothetical protein